MALQSVWSISPVWYIYNNDDIVLQALQDPQSHSVTYTLSRHQAVVVEYKQDEDTDMFQVGENPSGSKNSAINAFSLSVP